MIFTTLLAVQDGYCIVLSERFLTLTGQVFRALKPSLSCRDFYQKLPIFFPYEYTSISGITIQAMIILSTPRYLLDADSGIKTSPF